MATIFSRRGPKFLKKLLCSLHGCLPRTHPETGEPSPYFINYIDAGVQVNVPGPNFMVLLTISEELALAVAKDSVLTVDVFHGLARNFGVCACVFCITTDSVLIA